MITADKQSIVALSMFLYSIPFSVVYCVCANSGMEARVGLLFCFSVLIVLNVGGTSDTNYSCHANTSKSYSTYTGQLIDVPSLPVSQYQNVSVTSNDTNMGIGVQVLEASIKVSVYGPPHSSVSICVQNAKYHSELNITLQYCPPGFIDSPNRTCICDVPRKLQGKGILQCKQETYEASVFIGFCVSRENGTSELLVTRCPFANNIHVLNTLKQDSNGTAIFCNKTVGNREGKLCGKCIKDHGVSVFSDTFECILCNGNHLQYSVEYLAVEFIPTTVFFMIILYFHIGITTGPANGFIFFSQMVTTPLEILYVSFGLKLLFLNNSETNGRYLSNIMADVIVDPYCIWNLDFSRIIHPKICFSPHLSVIHILALRYISAIYPLLLLCCAYIIIELQARNVRPIMCLWKVICFPCVRWRRVWKAKTSIIDAFATCVLLSYNKFMYVSLLFLSPSEVYSDQNRYQSVLNFDPTIEFLKGNHIPFAILAVIIIIIFGIFPPLLLIFYQFQPFQACLESCKLRRQGVQQFVEAFQGCYKDGTNGKIDSRFFAGLYFIFRFIVLLINALSQDILTGLVILTAMSIVFMFLCAVIQPYKKRIYNIVDSFCFGLLGLITVLQIYIYVNLEQTNKLSRIFLFYYFLLYIPLLYIVCYVAHWLFLCYKNRGQRLYTPVTDDNFREPVIGHERSISPINISPRPSITHTEVSIAELSQQIEETSSEEEACEQEPLISGATVGSKQEMENFSKYMAIAQVHD